MFEIFPEGGHWCARRSDGLVCGLFRNRADAERFARLEDESGQPSPCQESAKTSTLTDPGLEMTARTG
ncbi:MAG TPA: hypothetical protein VGI89_07030 [Rhizomicrobium sp.]|jgi:hypothetical protein